MYRNCSWLPEFVIGIYIVEFSCESSAVVFNSNHKLFSYRQLSASRGEVGRLEIGIPMWKEFLCRNRHFHWGRKNAIISIWNMHKMFTNQRVSPSVHRIKPKSTLWTLLAETKRNISSIQLSIELSSAHGSLFRRTSCTLFRAMCTKYYSYIQYLHAATKRDERTGVDDDLYVYLYLSPKGAGVVFRLCHE